MRTSIALAVLLLPTAASAQTWAGRTTPALREIVALDATGEAGWPFGDEDVAGDGLARFQQQEANVDIRSVYATADGDVLWTRLYVSDTGGAGGNIVAFVFIDVDSSPVTGGGADAIDIRPEFTDDPSEGGYERVIGFSGNETVVGAWSWDGAAWVADAAAATWVTVESGTDRDPLLLGAEVHGYLQATVDHDFTGLRASCSAVLFVRTWNDVPSLNYGDLNVGESSACVPADSNDDRVPDVLEGLPCEDDDDCPGGGICVDGICLPGNPCETDADCRADETCIDGQCVPDGGEPCAPIGEQGDCPDGQVCGPNGVCVDPDDIGGDADADVDADVDADTDTDTGFSIEDGKIQGGACACRTGANGGRFPWMLAILLAVGLSRRRR